MNSVMPLSSRRSSQAPRFPAQRPYSAKPVSRIVIAKRSRQLDKFEASLAAALRRTPPAIPKLPPIPKVPAARTASGFAPAARRVVYVRPAPIVVHEHRAGGEHEAESFDRGDGGGGGGDD